MAKKMTEQPNIVVIMADDLGFSDLGCFGGEIDTPNLDQLAAEGQRFTQFYTNAKCSPSRAALLTGLYAEQVTEKADGGTLHARNNITIAEMLKLAGYRTMAAGKWHLGESKERRPIARGFDRYWGLLSGCSNYFNPGNRRPNEPEPGRKNNNDLRPWCDQDRVMHPFNPKNQNFYTTDAITDHAIEFLEEHSSDEKPFFLYIPHCAPHFPLQAWPKDIKKYRDRYSVGWSDIRQNRYFKLLELGLIDLRWGLPAADERANLSYENLGDHAVETMAVYAAMVDRLDQAIGRILDKLSELNKKENTLVLFLSDNGGCAEEIHCSPDIPPGTIDSYQTVGAAWANVSNTPFRLFKDFDHEGGISTPLIASWPARIKKAELVHNVAHIIDFMPTFAELADIDVPTEYNDRPLLPLTGKSLVPLFDGQDLDVSDRELFWLIGGAKAMRKGSWKIVTQGPKRIQAGIPIEEGYKAWELYDMQNDRCELHNLASRYPEKVESMANSWEKWHKNCLRDTGLH